MPLVPPEAPQASAGPAPLYQSNAPIFEPSVTQTPMFGGGPSPLAPSPIAPTPIPGEPQLDVVGPDGKSYKLPVSQIDYAKTQGFHFETDAETSGRKYSKEHPVQAWLNAWSRDHLNRATLGVIDDDAIDSALTALRGASPKQLAALRESAKHEKTASTIGEITGFAHSMLTGEALLGGIGAARGALGLAPKVGAVAADAATATGAGTIAKAIGLSAGRVGLESAAIEIPHAVKEVIEGDPQRAAESMAYAAGGGMVLGALGPLAMRAVEGTLGATGERLDAFRRRQFLKSAGTNEASLGKMEHDARFLGEGKHTRGSGGEELGRWFDEEGRPFARRPLEPMRKYGPRIDAAIDDTIKQLVAAKTATGAKANVDTGRWFSNMVEKTLAPLSESPADRELADAVRRELHPYIEHWSDPVLDDAGRVVERKWKEIPFDEAYAEQQKFSSRRVNWQSQNATHDAAAIRKLRSVWQDELFDQAISQSAGEDVASLRQANKTFAHLKAVQTGIDDNIYRLGKNATLSPTDKAAGFTTAGVLGATHGGLSGIGAGYGAAIGAKLVREHGNAILARLIPSGGGLKAIQSAMTQVGERFALLPMAMNGTLRTVGAHSKDILNALGSPSHDEFGQPVSSKPAANNVEAYNAFSKRLNDLATNPDKLQAVLEEVTKHFADQPQIAIALAQQMTNGLMYINGVRPKPQEMPNPLFVNEWKPSSAQMDDITARLGIWHDPLSIIDRINDGTIARPHMETLEAVWPSTANALRQGIMEYAIGPKAKPVKPSRLNAMQIAMGMKLTPAMQNLKAYEQMYAAEQQANEMAAKAKKIKGPKAQTSTQAIEAR